MVFGLARGTSDPVPEIDLPPGGAGAVGFAVELMLMGTLRSARRFDKQQTGRCVHGTTGAVGSFGSATRLTFAGRGRISSLRDHVVLYHSCFLSKKSKLLSTILNGCEARKKHGKKERPSVRGDGPAAHSRRRPFERVC